MGIKNYFLSVITLGFIFLAAQVAAKEKKDQKKDEGYQFTRKIEIPATSVKDQASSGTCWSFATTSFIESELIRLGKGTYDLSEMFFVHYAYPKKAVKYLRYQGGGNFGEGGQAHDVMSIIYTGINYGLTYHRHAEMVTVMKGILDHSLESKSSFSGKSVEVVRAALNIYLGQIPDTFSYQGTHYTPKSFSTQTGFNPKDYVELTSYECYPFNEWVNLEIPDNWSQDKYFNLPIDELVQVMNEAFAK